MRPGKSIVTIVADALAVRMACRSEPGPESRCSSRDDRETIRSSRASPLSCAAGRRRTRPTDLGRESRRKSASPWGPQFIRIGDNTNRIFRILGRVVSVFACERHRGAAAVELFNYRHHESNEPCPAALCEIPPSGQRGSHFFRIGAPAAGFTMENALRAPACSEPRAMVSFSCLQNCNRSTTLNIAFLFGNNVAATDTLAPAMRGFTASDAHDARFFRFRPSSRNRRRRPGLSLPIGWRSRATGSVLNYPCSDRTRSCPTTSGGHGCRTRKERWRATRRRGSGRSGIAWSPGSSSYLPLPSRSRRI